MLSGLVGGQIVILFELWLEGIPWFRKVTVPDQPCGTEKE
jgi:hypothetical protein